MVPRGTIEFISRVLWIEDGKVLVCRNLKHGHCYLPGGHVEFGERAAEAAIREMVEEAGVVVTIGSPIGFFEARFEQRGRERHELCVVFLVTGSDTPPGAVTSKEPEIGFEWIPVEQLGTNGFVPESQLELFRNQPKPLWNSV